MRFGEPIQVRLIEKSTELREKVYGVVWGECDESEIVRVIEQLVELVDLLTPSGREG